MAARPARMRSKVADSGTGEGGGPEPIDQSKYHPYKKLCYLYWLSPLNPLRQSSRYLSMYAMAFLKRYHCKKTVWEVNSGDLNMGTHALVLGRGFQCYLIFT